MMNTLDYILNKYNLKKDKVIEIPNMGRDQLAELFAELRFNIGAEIGVERGYYSEVLCKANPYLQLHCIDPWAASAYEPGGHAIDTEQEKYEQRYLETVKRLSPYHAIIDRTPSMEAIKHYGDNRLDFVYIDANHDFVNITNDLHYWLKKVRPGGIMSGHDYAYYDFNKFNHVKSVVNAYTGCYKISPLFIVGAQSYETGIRDQFRSWFFVKEV